MSVAPITNAEESKPVVHMSGVHHGNIVSNRKLMPPVVDPAVVEHSAYVPMEFAQSKVEEVSTDLNLLKTGYDHYICKMKIFYDNQNKETKSHYEKYILDLKKKALKHLEIERAKAKKREEELQASLAAKDEDMEDLRDMNAERISEFQAKIVQLKKQHVTDLSTRDECDASLKDILHVIERDAITKISNNLTEKFSKELNKKNDEVVGLQSDHSKTIQKLEKDKLTREQQIAKEKQELARVERSRAQQQMAQSSVSKESQVFMSDLLQQLQFKKQQLLLQKESKKVESLKKAKGERDKNLAQLKEELEAEKQRSAAAVQEYKDKCDRLASERDSLVNEQDGLVAQQDAERRLEAQKKARSDRAEVKAAMRCLMDGVEKRSRLDSELEAERRKINELNGIIAGLRAEIVDAEAKGISQGKVIQQQQQQSQHIQNPAPEQHQQVDSQSAAVVNSQAEEQKAADLSELEALRKKLAVVKAEVDSDGELLAEKMKEKVDTKADIKKWMKNFEAENGRPPNNEEKSSVRDMFVAHKNASKQVDSLSSGIETKKGEVAAFEAEILALQGKVDAAGEAATVVPVTGTTSGVGNVPDEVVAEYRQRISELEAVNAEAQKNLQTAELEKSSAVSLVETLKSEKRTDVIARYEREIEELKEAVQTMEASVAASKAEKAKQDSKLAEFVDRTKKAEEELQERDERDSKKVDQSEEMVALQNLVAKQRHEIVSKSKAATAGWDAAADTEEKYEIEVKKAYKKGMEEGKQKSKEQVDSLTAEIEEKEYRITELLEATSEAEQKAAQATADMQEAISNANVAIEEAMANGGGGGGGGGRRRGGDSDDDDDDDGERGEGGAMYQELQADFEAGQDEIASLCTQVENLQKSLEIANQKTIILEKLLAQAQTDVANVPTSSGGPAANIEELVEKVKQTTDTGTKLWKDNKKDECCDLYEKISKEIVSTNCQQNLLDTLTSALESAKGQSKRRGAVILRKGLDNFLVEAEKIHSSLASMLSPTPGGGGGVSTESHDALMSQLKALQDQAVAQKAMEKKSDTTSSADAGAGGGNAVLVKRAKTAEDKVKALQKELAAAKKAAPKAGKPVAGGSGKGSAEDAKEIKNLNKQIKDLEKQLNSGGGGGGGAAKEKIALANQEKKFKKEMKEIETVNRKEKGALEKELAGVNSELEKVTNTCNAAVEERDKLRTRVEELGNANTEMEALRAKADMLDEAQAQVKSMKKEVVDLSAQYKKEANLRKKYKNELEDLKGAIRVYARVRPFAKYEIEKDCQGCVHFPDETSVTVHTSRGDKEFEFDAAFRDTSTQEEVFEDTKRLVESMIDGYNVCLFAYGQTGSGKTFTMTGSADMPGLTPRAIGEMFHLISEKKNCTVRVSTYFVELYNDSVVDLYWLLDNKSNKRAEPPKLDIKVDAKKMVFIKNAVIKSVDSGEELLNLFHAGNLERHVGATKMNAESSRSHSIFAVMCESYDATTKKTTVGKLSLVDLAGSERADKTGAGAERLREAQSINKSLSALGDVISALSEGEKFIPYRNNKLTQLMQDSLGGNAKTLMFVNFSPADYNCDETVTSLSYATRVKKITNNASKQAESEEVARLKAMIKKLQGGQTIEEDGEEETKGS